MKHVGQIHSIGSICTLKTNIIIIIIIWLHV